MIIFSKASNTMDEKIGIVTITTYYYSLCPHNALIKYLTIVFKRAEQNRFVYLK